MNNIIFTCTNCRINFSKILKKCPYCGGKLMTIDVNKMPFERQPDYDFYKLDKTSYVQDTKELIDYTKFFK